MAKTRFWKLVVSPPVHLLDGEDQEIKRTNCVEKVELFSPRTTCD